MVDNPAWIPRPQSRELQALRTLSWRQELELQAERATCDELRLLIKDLSVARVQAERHAEAAEQRAVAAEQRAKAAEQRAEERVADAKCAHEVSTAFCLVCPLVHLAMI